MSSSERHLIEWQVCYADWAVDEEDTNDEEADPSDTALDDRTIRIKTFEKESDAMAFAKEYLTRHNDTQWLAYLEVRKCEIQVISKLK